MAVMEDTRQQLIAKLKTCKEQGLTFYQASQQLQQQGYIQAQITNAADQFNYKNPVANGSSADLVRPYAYVALAITAGYLGQSIYRFWLTRKFWGSSGNPRYLWANNLGYYLLAGVIGAGLAILGLKLYFRSKDRLYKRIDKSLSPPQDN
jgi:hypothetical protein